MNPQPSASLHYLIGDIHGCYEEFLELERKILAHARERESEAFILSLGDLLDRGPDSYKLVEHFIEGKRAGTHDCLMGNHELMFLELLISYIPESFEDAQIRPATWVFNLARSHQLEDNYLKGLPLDEFMRTKRNLWAGQGGTTTLASYGLDLSAPENWQIPEHHLRFYAGLPLFFETSDYVATHALAIPADLSLVQNPQVEDSLELRMAAWRLLWNRASVQIDHHEKINVSGHTPVPGVRRLKEKGLLQIDTGCVYGKNLTAWCAQTDSFLRVKAHRKYW